MSGATRRAGVITLLTCGLVASACGDSFVASTEGSGAAATGGSPGSGGTAAMGAGATGAGASGAGASVGGNTSNGGSSTGGSSNGGSGGSPPPYACPSQAPALDTPCAAQLASLICSYGDDPRPRCRAYFQCDGSQWKDYVVDNKAHCAGGSACGTAASGSTCGDAVGAFCFNGNALCECMTAGECFGIGGAGGSGGNQVLDGCYCCVEPEAIGPAGACPATPPNSGDDCTGNGGICRYHDPCHLGGMFLCTAGLWQWKEASGGECAPCEP